MNKAFRQVAIQRTATTYASPTSGIFTFPSPVTGQIVRARVVLDTGPSGNKAVFDVNKNGSTIYPGTKLEVANGATTGDTDNLTVSVIRDDEISIDLDSTPSTIGNNITLEIFIEEAAADYLELAEGSAPGNPASNLNRIYFKTDGLPYYRDDAGVETPFPVVVLGARVKKSAVQALTTGVNTAITFDQEVRDDGGWHDNATNNTRLTVPTGKAGWYQASGVVRFASNATGRRIASIKVNGTTDIAIDDRAALAANHIRCNVSAPFYLSAGDYVELYGFQDSGGNLNVENTNDDTWLAIIPAGRL